MLRIEPFFANCLTFRDILLIHMLIVAGAARMYRKPIPSHLRSFSSALCTVLFKDIQKTSCFGRMRALKKEGLDTNENEIWQENGTDGNGLAAGSCLGNADGRHGSTTNGFAPDNRKFRGIGGIGHHQYWSNHDLWRYRDFARLGDYRGRVDHADRGGLPCR